MAVKRLVGNPRMRWIAATVMAPNLPYLLTVLVSFHNGGLRWQSVNASQLALCATLIGAFFAIALFRATPMIPGQFELEETRFRGVLFLAGSAVFLIAYVLIFGDETSPVRPLSLRYKLFDIAVIVGALVFYVKAGLVAAEYRLEEQTRSSASSQNAGGGERRA